MTRELRRRHLWMWLVLGPLALLTLVAAIAQRKGEAAGERAGEMTGETGERAMSAQYTWVQWSPHKRVYDAAAALGVVAYLGVFVGISKLVWTGTHAISGEIVAMRALGSCAFTLLTMILCIGPLARLFPRFLPILYNRRHLGVMTFLLALAHAGLAVGYYHGFSDRNPLVSLLATNANFTSLRAFPYQILGLLALVILFLLASTSHDFWLKNLGARAWKALHMLVYPAYALLVGHVALGALQGDRGIVATLAVGTALVTVGSLHLFAGVREVRRDRGVAIVDGEDVAAWIDVGSPKEIPEDRARMVCTAGGERIAVFRHKGTVSAVTNVCAHQGGPLSEGKIIDGCITCPWHGWQYRAHDGCSPPPFKEKIATYQVRIVGGRVRVNPRALPAGTPTEPARIEGADDGRSE